MDKVLNINRQLVICGDRWRSLINIFRGMKTILILIITFLLILFSCKKSDESQNKIIPEIRINNIVCYPNDRISMEFEIIIKKGKEPFSYQWINPDTLKGSGPFTINLVSNLEIDVIITDSNNNNIEYIYVIKKESYDSLDYDYRNPYIGFYRCKVERNFEAPYDEIDTIYYDTVEISKHEVFTELNTSVHYSSVNFNYRSLIFSGYRISGRFINKDSISIFTWEMMEPGAPCHNYRGKKMNNLD